MTAPLPRTRRATALLLLALAACGRSMPADPAATLEVALGTLSYPTDPATIVAAEVHGDLLRLQVRYGGGCAQHRFELHMSGGFLEPDPVQARLHLAHDAGGDACRALLTETVQFELTPLRRAFEDGYPDARALLLLLHEPGAASPMQPPLRYEL